MVIGSKTMTGVEFRPTRTQMLKEKVFQKGYKGYEPASSGGKALEVCTERALLATEAARETEGEPEVIRAAKRLKKVLENMTIYIDEGTLIVGNVASKPNCLPLYPEIGCEALFCELIGDKKRGDLVRDEQERHKIKEIWEFWRPTCIETRVHGELDEKTRQLTDCATAWIEDSAHRYGAPINLIDWERLFKKGYEGILEEVKEKEKEIESIRSSNTREYLEKRHTLTAYKISIEAFITFGKRYAGLARKIAEKVPDEGRRNELLQIAEHCDNIDKPAMSFWHALQIMILTHYVVSHIEHACNAFGVRIDQVLYPFYKKDVDEGKLTHDEAKELIENAFIKLCELGKIIPRQARLNHQGAGSLNLNWTIGGITTDGDDACNEITELILDSMLEVRTVAPTLSLRYHPKVSRRCFRKAVELIKTGHGMPAIYNDAAIIPMLMAWGISAEDARNWLPPGCVRPGIPGKNNNQKTNNMLSLPKCLNLALFQGLDYWASSPFYGQQIGAKTKEPQQFEDIEDVFDAFKQQLHEATQIVLTVNNLARYYVMNFCPRPFASVLFSDAVGRMQVIDTWEDPDFPYLLVIGAVNAGNALAAIQKVAFVDKAATMAELCEALKTNYEGKEDLRQKLLAVTKFGNDDDYVDHWVRRVVNTTAEIFAQYPDLFGTPSIPNSGSVSGPVAYGTRTEATPDGRKAGEPFADGGVSPATGTDAKGPTAVIKSVTKLDCTKSPFLFNQKFHPSTLETEEGVSKFMDYIKTWADLGGYHIQFNVVDRDTLLAAQREPEKYQNLVVRVAGYSAYFVQLSKATQDHIIERTEHLAL